MDDSQKDLAKAMRSGDSIIRAESHGAAMSAPRASRGASSQSDSQPSAAPAGKLRSTATRGGSWKRRLVTTIAVIVALIGGAGPAAAQVLVSNIGQFSVGSGPTERLAGKSYAMPFTTGTNASGYLLESISIKFQSGSRPKGVPIGAPVGDPVYVYLQEDDGRGRPNHDSQVAVLTKAGSNFAIPTAGVNKYLTGRANNHCCPIPPPVHLNSTTQYWVYIWAGSSTSNATLDHTGAAEDAGGATGWSIGNSGFIHPDGTTASAYTSTGGAAQIQVEGTPNPEVLISISDATATEGPGVTADFVVTLNRKSSGTVTVDYLTLFTLSATPGVDFEHKSGTLTFRPGETSKTIKVPIIDDTVNDSGETFSLLLYDPKGADFADDTGIGTILNTEVLTGSFENVPAEHDGSTPFTFDAVFNSDIGISYKTLRDHSFTVTNGKVTRARRNNGRNDSWEITVTPWGNDAVTVTLPGNRDCGTTAAICTKEDHPVQLSNSPSGTVAGPPGVSTVPVTASFSNMPAEHDGSTFTFDLSFSENVAAGYARIRDHAFSVNGATIRKAQRKTQGSNQNWTVTVDPTGNGGVSITLPETTNCNNAGAICTDDGRKLNHSLSKTVAGPVGISVADARVDENEGAALSFAVTLSRAATGPVTVEYATSDGTATAGVDYTATSGTLTFQSGDTSKTISVAVLDDSHDEGEETLTLTLSNASGGRVTDGEATGTIENRDPMPRAFLARFGRTAAVRVVEHVEERIQAQRKPGIQARFAGQELRRDTLDEMALGLLSRLGASVGANRSGAGLQTPMAAGPMDAAAGPEGGLDRREHSGMGLGGGDLLTGSAFVLNHETGRGGVLSFWSRGGRSSFNGREGDLSLDGRVRTTMFGADYAKGPLVMGLSLANSRGRGGYAGVDIGEVVSSVTGLYPWLGYQVTDRLTVWGVTGYGKGALTLTPGEGTALKSGLSMAMAAGGLRGDLADSLVGGFGLAFKADVLWVGTGIEGVEGPAGRLAATDATVTRLRTGLETSRDYSFGRRLSLQPSLEVGLRRDGGDAETGVGADLGGGLIVSDTLSGLSADVRVRMLLAHQDEGFSERGVSLSFSYNPTPSTALGFIARLTPSWGGQATSDAEALWGRETMAGMADGGPAAGGRLEAELGYGMPVGGRLVGMPSFGIGASGHGRDYRLGYGLTVAQGGATHFDFGVYANRRESLGQGTAEHGVLGRLTARW